MFYSLPHCYIATETQLHIKVFSIVFDISIYRLSNPFTQNSPELLIDHLITFTSPNMFVCQISHTHQQLFNYIPRALYFYIFYLCSSFEQSKLLTLLCIFPIIQNALLIF